MARPQIGQFQCDECPEIGVGYDFDGRWLCEDCLFFEHADEAMKDAAANKDGTHDDGGA